MATAPLTQKALRGVARYAAVGARSRLGHDRGDRDANAGHAGNAAHDLVVDSDPPWGHALVGRPASNKPAEAAPGRPGYDPRCRSMLVVRVRCRLGLNSAVLAHNREVAGSNPAPATK